MDIPQKARYSDGKQNAQNDQCNYQLYEGKAAFSALLRCCVIFAASFPSDIG